MIAVAIKHSIMLYHTLKIVLNTRLLIIKNIIQYFSNELQRVYDEN